jgi:uncharacterized delta-60 repeat protein
MGAMLHALVRRTLVVLVSLAAAAHAATGSLDPQFGNGGTVTTPIPGLSGAEGVVVHGDGIVAVGSAGDDFGIARYLSNGMLDTGFGEEGTGIVSIFIGPPARAQAVGLRSDGLLLVAGGANGFATGVLDGASGEVVASGRITAGTYWGYGLSIAPDDSYVFSGEAGNGRGTCALAAFNDGGGEVPGFGTGGVEISDIGRCDAVLHTPDGKLVVTTNEDAAGTNGFGIARFTSTGDLDGSFGTGGVTLAFEDSAAFVRALARTADGKYIAVGQGGSGLSTAPKSLVVARFNENGTLDTGFINGGVIALGIPGSPIALSGDAVVIEPSGNIVVGGTASGPGNVKDGGGPSVFFLMRLLPDGTPDLSFGDDGAGAVITGFGTGSSAELHALALQPDGKVVAAGRTCLASNCAFALARYVLGAPGPVTTTTTTLPGGGGGGGCTQSGVDGLRCLCAVGVAPATCGGQTLRAPIGNTFRKACSAVEKGVAAPKPSKSRTQFKRVKTFLKQASAHTRRQAKKKKNGIDAACAGALEGIFSSGRTLADAVIATIPKK